jgi:putative ABC transport system permease protein
LVDLPRTWADQIRKIPGVKEVSTIRYSVIPNGGHLYGVAGFTGATNYLYVRAPTAEGRAAVLNGTGVLVGRSYAKQWNTKVGDTIDLPGARPARRMKVVGIGEGVVAPTGGSVAVSLDVYKQAYGSNAPTLLDVVTEPAADRVAVKQQIEQLVKDDGFPARVIPGDRFVDDVVESGNQSISLMAMMLLVITLCSGVALLNALLASVMSRTQQLAVLRAIGATQKTLRRSVATEALSMGLVGGLFGAIAGAVLHRLTLDALVEMTGYHMIYQFSPLTMILAMVASAGIAVIGGWAPTRRVAKMDLLSQLSR